MLVGETIFGGKKIGAAPKQTFLFFSIRFVECLSSRNILSMRMKNMCYTQDKSNI